MFGANITNDNGRLLLSTAADAYYELQPGLVRARYTQWGYMNMDNFGRFGGYYSGVGYNVAELEVFVRIPSNVTTPPLVFFRQTGNEPLLGRGGNITRRAKGRSSNSWVEDFASYSDAAINCIGYTRVSNANIPANTSALPSSLSWGPGVGGSGDAMYIFYYSIMYGANHSYSFRAFAPVPNNRTDTSVTYGMEIFAGDGHRTFTSRPPRNYYVPKVMQIESATLLAPPNPPAGEHSMSPKRRSTTVPTTASGSRWMAFSGDGVLTRRGRAVMYDQTYNRRSKRVRRFGIVVRTDYTHTTVSYYFMSYGIFGAGVVPRVYSGNQIHYCPIPVSVGRALSSTTEVKKDSSSTWLGSAVSFVTDGASAVFNSITSGSVRPLVTFITTFGATTVGYSRVGDIPAISAEQTRNDVVFLLRD